MASEKNLELHLCLECKKTTCLACLNKRKCHVCSGREQCPRMVQSETRCACCLMLRDLEVTLFSCFLVFLFSCFLVFVLLFEPVSLLSFDNVVELFFQ